MDWCWWEKTATVTTIAWLAMRSNHNNNHNSSSDKNNKYFLIPVWINLFLNLFSLSSSYYQIKLYHHWCVRTGTYKISSLPHALHFFYHFSWSQNMFSFVLLRGRQYLRCFKFLKLNLSFYLSFYYLSSFLFFLFLLLHLLEVFQTVSNSNKCIIKDRLFYWNYILNQS